MSECRARFFCARDALASDDSGPNCLSTNNNEVLPAAVLAESLVRGGASIFGLVRCLPHPPAYGLEPLGVDCYTRPPLVSNFGGQRAAAPALQRRSFSSTGRETDAVITGLLARFHSSADCGRRGGKVEDISHCSSLPCGLT
jgi:hypothetical protein